VTAPKKNPQKAGRKAEYHASYAKIAEKAALTGATDEEIAELFEVNTRTLYKWKLKYPELGHALKAGKELADERVERALYQKALGYRFQAVKIFMPANADKPVYAPYVEEAAPDTSAAIFWLKNRKPEEWRDKQEITGANGGPIQVERIERVVKHPQN
jgi:hypothetical protein